jgi:hypothetical protein
VSDDARAFGPPDLAPETLDARDVMEGEITGLGLRRIRCQSEVALTAAASAGEAT